MSVQIHDRNNTENVHGQTYPQQIWTSECAPDPCTPMIVVSNPPVLLHYFIYGWFQQLETHAIHSFSGWNLSFLHSGKILTLFSLIIGLTSCFRSSRFLNIHKRGSHIYAKWTLAFLCVL